MKKTQKQILISATLLIIFSFYIKNQFFSNYSIENMEIKGMFLPEFITKIDSSIYVIGSTGVGLDVDVMFFKIDKKKIKEIYKIKKGGLACLNKEGKNILFSGSFFNAELNSSNEFFNGEILNDSVQIFNNNEGLIYEILSNGNTLVKTINIDGHTCLQMSIDGGFYWEEIPKFDNFIAIPSHDITIDENNIYGHGSVKGLKPTDYLIFKYNLNTKEITTKSITKFKGGFDKIKLLNGKPSLITNDDSKVYVYDLTSNSMKLNYELTLPNGSVFSEIFKSDKVDVITTQNSPSDDVKIYSKKHGEKEWKLDLSYPLLRTFYMDDNMLISFDSYHNLIKITY